ncbi:hypothetical protein F4861DRAFT_310457 [Xylaria intraflava]|nr:hypothetical protein F4861DRAFT_310457 [Xylaria intraflava]
MVLIAHQPPGPSDAKSSTVSHEMEHTLRCNVLKCRNELGDRALVTTCYHIFCGDCATRLGLASQRRDQLIACPACGTHLTNPDDAVVTNLSPSEDYKTSVLSGLNPNVIIDCASRALSFWAYQVTQEIIYQQHMSKTLTDKYASLNVHLDKIVNEANAEITNCHNKLTSAEADRDELRKKYEELLHICKQKNRKLLQTQELYDKLKRKAMLGQVQDAAEDAVESTLQVPSIGSNGADSQDLPYSQFGDTYGLSTSAPHDQQRSLGTYNNPQANIGAHARSWSRVPGAQGDIPITPSTHRQRVGDPTSIGLSTIPGLVVGTLRSPRNQFNTLISPANISSNHFRGTSAALPTTRMSSGMKAGQGGDSANGFAGPSLLKTIQRPSSLLPLSQNTSNSTTQPASLPTSIRAGWVPHEQKNSTT